MHHPPLCLAGGSQVSEATVLAVASSGQTVFQTCTQRVARDK